MFKTEYEEWNKDTSTITHFVTWHWVVFGRMVSLTLHRLTSCAIPYGGLLMISHLSLTAPETQQGGLDVCLSRCYYLTSQRD